MRDLHKSSVLGSKHGSLVSVPRGAFGEGCDRDASKRQHTEGSPVPAPAARKGPLHEDVLHLRSIPGTSPHRCAPGWVTSVCSGLGDIRRCNARAAFHVGIVMKTRSGCGEMLNLVEPR